MKITEAKLRKMIRGVIQEFVSTGTVAGAKKKGYQSKTRKSAQSDYDTKKADYETKQAALDAFDTGKRYRRAAKGGGYDYSATMANRSWSENPAYTTLAQQDAAANRAKNDAETAKQSAKTTLDTEKAADLEKTVPKEKSPTGGGAGFGKGKSAGKGKAKGKKKKN